MIPPICDKICLFFLEENHGSFRSRSVRAWCCSSPASEEPRPLMPQGTLQGPNYCPNGFLVTVPEPETHVLRVPARGCPVPELLLNSAGVQ